MFLIMQFVRKNLKFSGRSKHSAYSFLVVFFLLTSKLVYAQEDNRGFTIDKIIAKVDNYIVLKSDLDRAYLDYVANGGTAGDYARCQFLALLVRNKLMMAKAEIDSVVVSDGEVDDNTERRMSMILSQYGGSAEELERKFEKSFDQIKVELRDQIREQMVVSEMERTITKGLTVTPAEVKRFYAKIPKDSLPFFSAEVEVAQIVKVAKISEKQKEITRNELIALRDQILSGADFGTLAKKYSSDPSVTSNNGDMGWVGRGRMVPQYEATAFKMKIGEISMPFETDYGLHILQLLGRRGNEYHSRHILIAPKPSDEDLKVAAHYLDSIRANILESKEMTFQKAAKEFSDDMMTKGSGGFFTDQDGGTRISVDEIDPAIFFAIDTMKVGSVSKPLTYRTDEGRDAVRILFYKSRMAPHVASLTDDWTRIQGATLGQKKNKVLEKWFDKARKDVFISIDSSYDFCGILDE
jgi:peptidyl-prolyl cis-trans isomerase SurA